MFSIPLYQVMLLLSVMLHTTSKVMITGILVLHVISLLQISFASAVSTLSDRTRFKNFFRTYPNFGNFVPALLSVLNHYNWSRIVFLTQDENLFNKVITKLNTTFTVCIGSICTYVLLGCHLIDFPILVLILLASENLTFLL